VAGLLAGATLHRPRRPAAWWTLAGGLLFLLVVLCVAGLVRQVEEQAEQLAALARHDGLTGMPNRRA
jgi:hypothetical protein